MSLIHRIGAFLRSPRGHQPIERGRWGATPAMPQKAGIAGRPERHC